MVFSSVIFLFLFLPLVLLGHTVLWGTATFKAVRSGKPSAALLLFCNFFLLLCSLFFYAWGGPRHTILLLAVALVNFLVGVGLERAAAQNKPPRRKKHLLALGAALNLGTLVYYKYFNLFLDSGGENLLKSLLPASVSGSLITSVALPLGVSFYVFQGICYIIDVYRGQAKASANPVTFFCYFAMFPPLVAGPIVRYASIAGELQNRFLSWERMRHGAARFTLGLAKKVLLADAFALIADAAFSEPAGQLGQLAAWAGIVAYTFQIYFDFSAYSDMAIGLGHMFGFTFPENFNYPYISRSITEFWRRWHMTLSNWFRDYVYIPLGGNRRGSGRTALNLFIVFALCGFWHGANWTFMAWGLHHGAFLAVERLFPRFFRAAPRFLAHIYTIAVFMMGWVLFRADSFSHALSYYKSLLGFYPSSPADNKVWLHLFGYDVIFAYVFGVIVAMPLLPWLRGRVLALPGPARVTANALAHAGLLALLVLAFLPVFGSTHIPFIYFRF